MIEIEVAINAVLIFLVLYFSYYYLLRFIQSVFQGTISTINQSLGKFIYALGTPAHELAHLFVAKLCFSKINKVKLFPSNGQTGFVSYSVGSSIPFFIPIKNFFIGIAPALINIPLFIFIEKKFVLKGDIVQILHPSILLSKEGYITIGLFLLLISCIAPSYEDLKGMFHGLVIFSIIIFVIAYFTRKVIDISSLNISWIIIVMMYYLEIIIGISIINAILNYKNFIKVTSRILLEAVRHTFKKN